MKLSGWGRYPALNAQSITPNRWQSIPEQLWAHGGQIARGQGRSYGDSALGAHIISTESMDHFLEFNPQTGILSCEAGVTLAQILQVTVPQGWFLQVTPGTKFVSVGGAIASDVHGKNHHHHGSFSTSVCSLQLLTTQGSLIACSATQNADIFHATCGGMGLTGIIVSATIQLLKIDSSWIAQRTLKTQSLAETLEQFENTQSATYSVAWIDCLAKGEHLGRSLIMLGEHATQSQLSAGGISYSQRWQTHQAGKLSMPFALPNFVLNRWSIKAFNELYYRRVRQADSHNLLHYDPYFYPLDGIHHWNRMYGAEGFLQYQFVIPFSAGLAGLQRILTTISQSQKGSFLAVLKVFGEGNDNYLSFPVAGYTLALDFKIDHQIWALLDRLDQMVLEMSGRLYLAKDARMSAQTFHQSYPNLDQFIQVREQLGAHTHFHSAQSMRLGLI